MDKSRPYLFSSLAVTPDGRPMDKEEMREMVKISKQQNFEYFIELQNNDTGQLMEGIGDVLDLLSFCNNLLVAIIYMLFSWIWEAYYFSQVSFTENFTLKKG